MAITNSDLNNLLDAIRSGGDIDVVRKSVEMLLQALIDAEATAPSASSGARRGPPSATATETAWSRPRLATSSSRSPSFARAASSLRSWSVVAGSTRLSTPW